MADCKSSSSSSCRSIEIQATEEASFQLVVKAYTHHIWKDREMVDAGTVSSEIWH